MAHQPTSPLPTPRFPSATRSASGERSSRFIETPMEEYTPVNSIYEEDLEELARSATRIALRGANAVLHLTACVLLLAIMAIFLSSYPGLWFTTMMPEAVTLIILLALDMCIDVFTLIRARHKRPGWALFLRVVFGVGYLAVFMVYVGFGRVFPYSYTYWDLSPGYAGPIVYLFLWLLGVWNLLNTALHRHRFGQDMRAYTAALRSLGRRDGSGSASGSAGSLSEERGRVNGRGGHPTTWTRTGGQAHVDVERGAARNDAGILLQDRHAEPKTDIVTPTTTSISSAPSEEAPVTRPPPALVKETGI